jgi:N-methylhydantoinase A/oxoprolinase/acetone carboxylase beta subunit
VALLLGIDTGGTYTDAVLLDDDHHVVASAKALTTRHDLAIGVREAIEGVLGGRAGEVRLVSLSTTLATNAIVEGQGNPVGLLMIGFGPEVLERAGLRAALGGDPVAFIPGGHSPLGEEQAPLDIGAARAAIEEQASRVSAFAVASYFAVRNPAHERAVRELVHELTGKPVSCAHELSSELDAPRRALTALLNARLIPLIRDLVVAARSLLAEKGICAPLMVVKGDGSLISAAAALDRPVETILSGPAASVVGARHLSGERDVVVVDMGGTTTDIALLHDGWPVLDHAGATVAGWHTMVEAIAVHTVGLGGDSELAIVGDRAGVAASRKTPRGDGLVIGPRRVMPLSLLVHLHPGVLDTLRLHAGREPVRDNDGRFALRLRPLDEAHARLGAAEARVWELLEDGPVAIERLFDERPSERPLARLVERGLALVAGFTPSDAAHVLGLQEQWSAEAARLGAEIQSRRAQAGDVEAFCRRVVDGVALRGAEAIVDAVLAEEIGGAAESGATLGRRLIGRALDRGADFDTPTLHISFSLRRPLVAIGAPAATYFPGVAERLNARLVLPPSAEVSNAVGAAVGGVSQTVAALITAPYEGRFRVHLKSGIQDFGELEAAARHAAHEAERLARGQAEASGAGDIEVATRRRDRIVKGADGRDVFIETRVTATATGKPRLADG